MTTLSPSPSANDPAEEFSFFVTTASLLPPGFELRQMGEILTFTTKGHSYSLKGDGLPSLLPTVTGEAIRHLRSGAILSGFDGLIGLTISPVIDPAARTITVVAIGTPVKVTREVGAVKV